jgi:hypothetical protein
MRSPDTERGRAAHVVVSDVARHGFGVHIVYIDLIARLAITHYSHTATTMIAHTPGIILSFNPVTAEMSDIWS